MQIKTISSCDLVRQLDRSYFVGVSTFGPCANGCGKGARGSGYCKQCIIDELRSRGVSGGLINKYCQHQNKRINVISKLEKMRSQIINGEEK